MASDAGNEAGDRDGAEGASGADRLTAPPDRSRRPRLPFPVVGIGASAGGLEAFTEFLDACPPDAGMAYILVQHLPPDRESLLAELLARHSPMPVLEVEEGRQVDPDHVYIIRPGHTLTLRDGRLRLGPELAARGHGRPVDDLFRSLAEEQQQRAVAVVFSGMGSNGTAGAQAVKAVGGLVIAQEPESAKYPGMPRSLIDSHLPDYILRPSEVPEALARYASQSYTIGDDAGDGPTPQDEQALAEVLAVLRTRTRHDFAGYRKPTLRRRVQRRMGLGQFESMADYARALRQTPAEVTALADDLLIHVTGFFRDPEAWEVLRKKVIDPMAAERPDGSEVRCWVSACATGEEAYSLAMLLVEAAERVGKRFDVKVFATDMAERALGAARAGVFPNGIESEVAPERLARFFDRDDSFYRIRKELRELVIFAPQNILQDPPFSRLDLATCRNLLIYLEPGTQRRVLDLLHFGLREGGVLMLGSSESAALADGDFEPIDKRHRIFRRVGPTRAGALDLPALVHAARDARLAQAPPVARPAVPGVAQNVGRVLLERHTPAAVAVDAAGMIVHVHGDTSRFLALPYGAPSLDLLAMANDQVRGAVRTAMHRAADAQASIVVRNGLIDTPEGRRRVEVGAAPLGPRGGQPLYLVTFRDYPEPQPPPQPAGDGDAAGGQLAEDLQRARNELQGALEEMQSSNEELKAAHEEATSLNEELQSTNEELETSKEEMQSLNEELVTVNAQLQAKMGELEATANDLGSLLTSTDIAVLFLDPKFRIRRFTPAVKDLLELIPSDVGRPFVDLRLKFADPELLADAQKVLDRLVPIERAVDSESGRSYLRRVLPYRTQDDRIDGVVVAFVDVTERRKADHALRDSEARLSALVRAGGNAVYRMSPDWRRMLQLDGMGFLADATSPSESWVDRYIPPDDRPSVLAAIDRAIREKAPFELEHRVNRADGTIGWTYSRAVPLIDARGEITEWFGAAGDVTARMQVEAALRANEARMAATFEALPLGVGLVDAGGTLILWNSEMRRYLPTGVMPSRDAERRDRWRANHPDGRPVEPDDFPGARALRGETVVPGLEMRYTRDDGTEMWTQVSSVPIRDAEGRVVGQVAAVADITDRKRIEAELRESEGRFRAVVDLVPDLLWEGRGDGFTDWYNRRWLEYTGQTFEQASGWGWTDAIHPDDRERSEAAYRRGVEAGEPVRQEHRIRQADGAYRWFLVHAVPVASPGGATRWYGAATDIDEEKRAAEDLRGSRDRLERRVAERTAELARANAALEEALSARKELLRRLVTAQEDERRRISRELHDGLGQELTALILGLKALEASVPGDGPGRARLAEVKAGVDRIGREAHDLAVELRPTALDDIGLDSALSAYIARWSQRVAIDVEYRPVDLDGDRLPADVETAVYRVVQEALNNAAKHADPSRVVVMVARHGDELIALIEDDGRGFDPARGLAGGGRKTLGILGMRERVSLVGGTLAIDSVLGEGTVVRARIPLNPSPEDHRDGD